MVNKKRKKMQKRRYLAAFAITALIFTLGFFAGLVIDSQRAEYLMSAYNEQRIEYGSIQLQYQLIEQITRDGDCEALTATFEQNINNLENARIRLETYQQDATLNEAEFNLLSREYTHAQIRYYLLAERTQELCGEDIATILYFYSDSAQCPDCEDQAFVLTYLKRLMQDRLLVFSFNSLMVEEEPTIRLLMNRYEITEFPTIVVNQEVYAGLTTRNELLENLCDWFREEHSFCT